MPQPGHGSLSLSLSRAVAAGIGCREIMNPSLAILQLQLSKHVLPCLMVLPD